MRLILIMRVVSFLRGMQKAALFFVILIFSVSCGQNAEFAEILRGPEPELVALHINSLLAKNKYARGEPLDISWLFVQGEYSDKTKRKLEISVEENILGYDAMKMGEQTLKVFVGAVSAEWTIVVSTKAPKRLEILSPPNKTEYPRGEAFCADGLSARLVYTDATADELFLDENSVIGFSSENEGEILCAAVWQGQRAQFSVNIVAPVLVSVRTDNPPNITQYVLTADGANVRAVKGLAEGGAEIPVADGAFFPLTDGILFTGTYTDGSERQFSAEDAVEIPYAAAKSGVTGVSFLFGTYAGAEIRSGFTAQVYEHDYHICATVAYGSFSDARELFDEDKNIVVLGKAEYSAGHNGVGAFGSEDSAVKIEPFLISASEISYTEWVNVRDWAQKNEYLFAKDAGIEGSIGDITSSDKSPESDKRTGQPAVYVNFRDVVVFCNAKSRMEGLEPVYFSADGKELTDAENGACDNPVVRNENDGYRLPTAEEWEFAARGGLAALYAYGAAAEKIPDNFEQKSWSYPFAGTADISELSRYCVYETYEGHSTKRCASLNCNSLGLYDMSGNVAEWTENRADSAANAAKRLAMGGSYYDSAVLTQISCRLNAVVPKRTPYIGFRTVRRPRER